MTKGEKNEFIYMYQVPQGGDKITIHDGVLQVPHNPIIPFVEGDGTGRDIWRASVRVFDAAVEKAYGQQAENPLDGSFRRGEIIQPVWLRGYQTRLCRHSQEYLVGIKGPLTTPIDGGYPLA